VKQGDCVRKELSIVFYVFLDSLAVPIATPLDISTLISNLNARFEPICVKFLNCSTVYIPNHTHAIWTKQQQNNITETVITAGYYTPKTINMYVIDKLDPLDADEFGYTYYPPPANPATAKKDLMVIHKGNLNNNGSAFALHLLGHYFGLPHTFAEINPGTPASPLPPPGVTSHEFADGSNCATHGDGFCDTEADSGLTGILKDGHNEFYVLPIDNLMGYHNQRCRFSNEQYLKMAEVIRTQRFYLH
jgi:hypothetical protein